MASTMIIADQAKALRDELGLGEDEVIGNIVSLIKDVAGYEYEEVQINEPFYGCTEYMGSGIFKISYNLNFDWNPAFKRFTLAHELGHISIHHEILREQVLHRCYTNEQFNKEMEIEADCFAANFLAPSNACSRLTSGMEFSPESIALIASHFNISTYSAALRQVELTDLTCSFIVSNKNGRTEYERRSPNMLATFKHPFIHKTKVHPHTMTSDFIQGKISSGSYGDSLMRYWYPEIKKDAIVKEYVIDLGYNEKVMTLLTPEFADYEAFLSEEDKNEVFL